MFRMIEPLSHALSAPERFAQDSDRRLREDSRRVIEARKEGLTAPRISAWRGVASRVDQTTNTSAK